MFMEVISPESPGNEGKGVGWQITDHARFHKHSRSFRHVLPDAQSCAVRRRYLHFAPKYELTAAPSSRAAS